MNLMYLKYILFVLTCRVMGERMHALIKDFAAGSSKIEAGEGIFFLETSCNDHATSSSVDDCPF